MRSWRHFCIYDAIRSHGAFTLPLGVPSAHLKLVTNWIYCLNSSIYLSPSKKSSIEYCAIIFEFHFKHFKCVICLLLELLAFTSTNWRSGLHVRSKYPIPILLLISSELFVWLLGFLIWDIPIHTHIIYFTVSHV